MRRSTTAAFAFGLLLTSPDAAGDPLRVRIQTEAPRLICVPPLALDARCRELPPGRFLDEQTWSELDLELRRAQDAETRLRAENESFRKVAPSWQPGWITLASTLLVGAVGGWYVHSKIF